MVKADESVISVKKKRVRRSPNPQVRGKKPRKPARDASKLEKWICKHGGFQKVSDKLGLHRQTVINWCQGTATPNLKVAVELIALADGELDFVDLIVERKVDAWD